MQTNAISILGATALSLCLFWSGGCGSNSSDQEPPKANITVPGEAHAADSLSSEATGDTAQQPPRNFFPEVQIKTNVGRIRIRLNAEKAPQTVENFLVNYVDRSYYDGTVFHYVEPDFIVIAGGYSADLKPKSTRAPIRNEARKASKNVRGTIAMSRDPEYADSATSQFFINLVDNTALDYQESDEGDNVGYCVFGKVVEGMDVVDRIAAAPVHDVGDFPNVPVETVVIESVTRVAAD